MGGVTASVNFVTAALTRARIAAIGFSTALRFGLILIGIELLIAGYRRLNGEINETRFDRLNRELTKQREIFNQLDIELNASNQRIARYRKLLDSSTIGTMQRQRAEAELAKEGAAGRGSRRSAIRRSSSLGRRRAHNR